MKIVVIGGTGPTGSKVEEKVRQEGDQAIAAAPNTGGRWCPARTPAWARPNSTGG